VHGTDENSNRLLEKISARVRTVDKSWRVLVALARSR
jgi:hypothetical protein